MLSTRVAALAGALLATVGARAADGQQFRADPRIDRIFAEWDKPDSPGCAVGVVQNGRFVYARGYGMANLDYDLPNSPAMVYYIGSDSKQFAAAAVALLSLDGRLSLDDDIRKYFPEMRNYGTPVTVRHLVYHTSGIRDIYGLMSLAGLRMEDVFPDSAAIALIARQKELNFKPGDDYLYSNSGYFLLGQIVKRVSGKSLREYADERIFRPLGMTHTHFHDDPGHIMKRRAMSYESDGRGGYRISYLQNFDKIGAGGLYSNLDDLRKWDENYYTKQVGGEPLQKLIHTRGVLNKGDTLPYAFGNNVSAHRGLRITEHGGALMGYKAYIVRFPDHRFSVLETCNLGSIDPGPLAYAVAEVFLGEKMGPKTERPRPAPRPAAAASGSPGDAGLSGDYYSEEVDATWRVVWDGHRLTVALRNSAPQTLTPTGPDSFRSGPITLRFERSGPGTRATGFTVEAERVRNMRFERR